MSEHNHRGAGAWYYCVKTAAGISKDNEIYVSADRVEVDSSGSLHFLLCRMGKGEDTFCALCLAPGSWLAFYSASVLNGSPVFVDGWEGELEPYDI